MSVQHNRRVLPSLALIGMVVAASSCSSSRSGPPAGSPTAPSQLNAILQYKSKTAVQLNWVDNSDNESSFEIYRAGGGKSWILLASTKANTTKYVDSKTGWKTKYTYFVLAKNNSGASGPTNTVEIQTPASPRTGPIGGGGGGGKGCGIILSDFGVRTQRPGQVLGETMSSVCLFDSGKNVRITDVQKITPDGDELVLRGGANDAVGARINRWEEGESLHFQSTMSWRNPPDGEDWELCFAVHDSTTSDIRSFVGTHGLSRWVPQDIRVPVIGKFPIVPDQRYSVRITVDRRRATFSVRVGGITLAADTPLDRILVMPAMVIGQVRPRDD
jgi:hypothetical protein